MRFVLLLCPLVLEMLVREGAHHGGVGEGAHLDHKHSCSCSVTLEPLLEIIKQMYLHWDFG